MTTQAKPCVAVAAGILWKSGRFLAAKRPEGKPRAGYWEFPGGKREAQETIEETLRREIKEELDLSCEEILPAFECSHEYPDIIVELHFLHVLSFAGEPAAKDGQELRWVTPEEALSLNFLPADREILSDLNKCKINFK